MTYAPKKPPVTRLHRHLHTSDRLYITRKDLWDLFWGKVIKVSGLTMKRRG